jgi:galactokinase
VTGKEILDHLNSRASTELFASLYGAGEVDAARQRYRRLIEELQDLPREDFPETAGELRVFSVPGRTELGGNHTDHNQGKVLAASIQLDAVAVVAPRKDKQVFFRSAGHSDVKIDISDLSLREEEKYRTEALIRGIAAEFAAQGTPVGGFTANADNMVLTGSGLSSSAAIEVLFAKIFDNLYSNGQRSALQLAKIGQKAENVYFGKPCGLMDQIACASGGVVAIDFKDLQNPKIKGINFDPAAVDFALCIVNTRVSHADLTPDYAAIPAEMKAVAAFYGKTVLRELDEENWLSRLPELRKAVGDRAVLRALHFFDENLRVDGMLDALQDLNDPSFAKLLGVDKNTEAILENLNEPFFGKRMEVDKYTAAMEIMEDFLFFVNESGDSSSELLQNIYSPRNPAEQGMALALALTRNFLEGEDEGEGACRVHGGGFAGTIQAYVPMERLDDYRRFMEEVFGTGALTVLRIRQLGAVEVFG